MLTAVCSTVAAVHGVSHAGHAKCEGESNDGVHND